MEGHLQVAPGATLKAGYDFTLPGNHNSLTMTVSAAQVTVAVSCVSGATPSASTFTVTMQAQAYQVTNDQWYPAASSPVLSSTRGRPPCRTCAAAAPWTWPTAVQDSTATVLVVAEAMHDSASSDMPELIAAIADELNAAWSTAPVTTLLSQSAPRFTFWK